LEENVKDLKFAGELYITKIISLEGLLEQANVLKETAINEQHNAE
jgi:hypothetical protein